MQCQQKENINKISLQAIVGRKHLELSKQNSLTNPEKNVIEEIDPQITSKNGVSNIEPDIEILKPEMEKLEQEMEKSKPEIDKLSEQEVHSFKPEVVSENSKINVIEEKDIVIEELPVKPLQPKEVEALKWETDKTVSKVPIPATRRKKSSQKNTANSALFLIGSFNESNTDYSLIMKQKQITCLPKMGKVI